MVNRVADYEGPGPTAATNRAEWYVLGSGQRHVVPYVHTFTSHAKGRWVGRSVFEVLAAEFPGRCTEARLAIDSAEGRLRLNGAPVAPTDVFADGDALEHDVERTEPSVPDTPIVPLPVVREGGGAAGADADTELLAVCKPAGVPVHHAGRYRRNTLVELLQA